MTTVTSLMAISFDAPAGASLSLLPEGRCLGGHPSLARHHQGDLVVWLPARPAGRGVRPALGHVQTVGDPARPPAPGLATAELRTRPGCGEGAHERGGRGAAWR